MTLGDIIKRYRNEQHVSMDYVANLCGITKGYVAMLERNINSKTGRPIKPSIETIVKICKGLHLDIDEVFDELYDDYEFTVPAASGSLSSSEEDLLSMFRELNEEGQNALLDFCEFILSKNEYKKNSEVPEEA